jgi:hypothetical protein
MALKPLYIGHKDTKIKLDPTVAAASVVAGLAAEVGTNGLKIAGADSTKVVGLFGTQGNVNAYESTGLINAMLGGEPGNAGGGDKVMVFNAMSVVMTDQIEGTPAVGAKLGTHTNGKLKAYASGDVVGIVLEGPKVRADGFNTAYIVKLYI